MTMPGEVSQPAPLFTSCGITCLDARSSERPGQPCSEDQAWAQGSCASGCPGTRTEVFHSKRMGLRLLGLGCVAVLWGTGQALCTGPLHGGPWPTRWSVHRA